MEFFNVSFFTGFFAACIIYTLILFLLEMLKKLQHRAEAPKVGKHKESKEVCESCKCEKGTNWRCWCYDVEIRKNKKQTG